VERARDDELDGRILVFEVVRSPVHLACELRSLLAVLECLAESDDRDLVRDCVVLQSLDKTVDGYLVVERLVCTLDNNVVLTGNPPWACH